MRRSIVWAAIAAIAASLPGSARADEPLERIGVGGEALVSLRGASDREVSERAGLVYERLRYILSDPSLRVGDVRSVCGDGRCDIWVKNRLLVRVTAEDALRNRTNVQTLSGAWAANFRRTLTKVNVASERNQRYAGTASLPRR